jgi:hypothetical protein
MSRIPAQKNINKKKSIYIFPFYLIYKYAIII